MRRRQHTISIVTLVAVAGGLALAPAAASAGSLLSGYGGPGQGNQEILGATLLNGPSGGGGGGSASGEGSTRDSAVAGAEGVPAGAPAGGASKGRAGAAGARRHGRGQRSGKHAGAGAETASTNGFGPRGALSARLASSANTVASPILGVSDADLVYIFLALGALALTGALTRQLARRPRQGS
jgi:hypothetical protein